MSGINVYVLTGIVKTVGSGFGEICFRFGESPPSTSYE